MVNINHDLNNAEYKVVQNLIRKYIHTCGPEDFKEAKMPVYKIVLKNYKPIAGTPYCLSLMERTELNRQMDKLKLVKVIEDL